MRNYPVFQISEKGEKKLKDGHVWAFDEELTLRSGEPRDGETRVLQLSQFTKPSFSL